MLIGNVTVECDNCQKQAATRLHGLMVELPRDWISTRPVFNTQNLTRHFCSADCFNKWHGSQHDTERVKVID